MINCKVNDYIIGVIIAIAHAISSWTKASRLEAKRIVDLMTKHKCYPHEKNDALRTLWWRPLIPYVTPLIVVFELHSSESL